MKGALVEQERQHADAQQHAEQIAKLLHYIHTQSCMLEGLAVKRNEAEQQRQEVQLIKEEQTMEADAIKVIQEEAQRELALTEPALQMATEALNSIRPADIGEIASYAQLCYLIRRIIDGVSILRYMKMDPYQPETYDYKGTTCNSLAPFWTGLGQTMFKSQDFLKSLSDYNLEFINEEICDIIQPSLNMVDFNQGDEECSCHDAAGLCDWVRNMAEYHQVAKVVKPKKMAAAATQANRDRGQGELAKTEAQLGEKEAALDELLKT